MAEGHRKRLRERVAENGLNSLFPHEVLEFLLQPLIPRRATNELAHRLLKRYGSLYSVLSAETQDLQTVQGMTAMAAEFLPRLLEVARMAEASFRQKETRFHNLETVHSYFKSVLKGEKIERMLLFVLDDKKTLLKKHELSCGTRCEVLVDKREIMLQAIIPGAKYVAVCHNHPFGSAKPTWTDLNATFEIEDILDSVGVLLYDHVVYGNNGLFSFREAGALGWAKEQRSSVRSNTPDYFYANYQKRQEYKKTDPVSEQTEELKQ